MRLTRIGLRGLTTFTDAIDIDITQLPEGLICVVGENGSGKTTLLESMAAPVLDRAFISRADGKLVDYATARDAYIDNTYDLEDRGTFRARVNLDGVKRVTDALLEQIHGDGRVERLNDGKATTFDTAVRRIFPSRALMTATVFAAQNRQGSFLTASKAQRKDLFAELIGSQHYAEKEAAAKRVAADLTTRRAADRAIAQRLQAETSEAIRLDLDARAQKLTAALFASEERGAALAAAAERARAVVDERRGRVAQAEEAARGIDAVETRLVDRRRAHGDAARALAALETDRDDAVDAAAARATAALARVAQRLAALKADAALEDAHTQRILDRTAALDQERASIDARIVKNRALVDRAQQVREGAAEAGRLEADRPRLLAAVQQADAAEGELRERVAVLSLEIARLDLVPAQLAQAEQAAALLETVPCGGAPPYDGCALLANAVAAKARIPELIECLAERAQKADALEALHVEQRDAANERTVAKADLAASDARLATLKPFVTELPFLADAEQRIADYEASKTAAAERAAAEIASHRAETDVAIADLGAQRAAAEAEQQRLEEECQAEQRAARARFAAAAPAATAAIASIAGEITALEHELAGAAALRDRLDAVRGDLADAEDEWAGVQGDLADHGPAHARLLEQQAAHLREIEAINAKLRELAERERQLDLLERDMREWEQLAKALGRDGLPTIEIDAAGPVVSDLANDLLEHALGCRRFTVSLETQEAKADGKGLKETFELKVIDSERGNAPRDVTDLSGGEQVIIDETLKAAIAVFVNQRNERPLRTCWRDETTGALDPENAIRYVAMLRRLQQLAGFHQIFMVSHNPTVTAMADAQLQVANGQVIVGFPPYQEVA